MEKNSQILQVTEEVIADYMKREIPYIEVLKSRGNISRKINPYTSNHEYKNYTLIEVGDSTCKVLKEFFNQKWVKAQPQDKKIIKKSKEFFVM